MKTFNYTIQDEQGIHARPAGLLAKFGKTLTSQVTIATEAKSADITRLMAVMSLGIKSGQEVVISVEGENEEADAQAVQAFLAENL